MNQSYTGACVSVCVFVEVCAATFVALHSCFDVRQMHSSF